MWTEPPGRKKREKVDELTVMMFAVPVPIKADPILTPPAPKWPGGNYWQPPIQSGLTFHKFIVVCLQRSSLLGHDGFEEASAEPTASASAGSLSHQCLSQPVSEFAEDKSAFHPRRLSHKRLSEARWAEKNLLGLSFCRLTKPSVFTGHVLFFCLFLFFIFLNIMWLKCPGFHYFPLGR